MVYKYKMGTPIETDAVTEQISVAEGTADGVKIEEEKIIMTLFMNPEDRIYGLGENVRGINKRGWIYKSSCIDNPVHREDTMNMYCAHNFFVLDGALEKKGCFFDTPSAVTFDMGYSDSSKIEVTAETTNLYLYEITGNSAYEIIREFRRMIGRSYFPPKWAFGYQQSRWGYKNTEDIREVVRQHREAGIPLDAVYLDIDYMERYKDFTIDRDRFPDMKAFIQEMKEEGIRLVPIIDAGVKVEEGYPVYQEGVENGYFCRDKEGGFFTAGVWPGYVHFPDFMRKEVREWFGMKYKMLLDMGIQGFWNDMNEPAFFYRKQRLDKTLPKTAAYIGKNLDGTEFFGLMGEIGSLGDNSIDYPYMLHTLDGTEISHDKVHNMYGYSMTRAAAEAFDKLSPDKRILLFSRSSYIGMHRYGGMWQGDNLSWWSHLEMNIRMMPSLNMCGFLYSGADLGGFGSNVTEDLMLRWIAFGIFTPLMRNHSTSGTRNQEVYQFSATDTFRKFIEIRYALIPYIYSEFARCVKDNDLLFQPLCFQYPEDERTGEIEDQLLMGESIMITPVYKQNAKGRFVYFPEEMIEVRMKSVEEVSFRKMQPGDSYIPVSLDEIVFFVRKNRILPMVKPARNVDDLDETGITLVGWKDGCSSYQWYRDDGYTTAPEQNGWYEKIVAENGNIETKTVVEKTFLL